MKFSPFSTSPDPDMLYITPSIKSTIDKVMHLIDYRQGLTTIVADVGHGKSTVIRHLWNELSNNKEVSLASVLTPNFPSDFAMLKAICGEYGIAPRRGMLAQESSFKDFLANLDAEGKTAVILIDEAQRLTGKQLELIRVMLNFETPKYKLVQIVLAGQMELKYKLLDASKKALRSRIFAPSNLSPLSPAEMRRVIEFRCLKAGSLNPFTDEALQEIYNQTSGVPRDVLSLCQILWAAAAKEGIEEIPAEWVEPMRREAVMNA
jgi:general secretion pathway protein A